MKITKKCIAMTAALLICFILRGDILQCPCYTYHFEEYIQYTAGYIISFLGYISIFLVFACGFFEIYNLKRLGLIFLAIQPAKLIIDIFDTFMYDRFGLNIFYPLLGLSLVYILIYFVDLFISDRHRCKEIIRQNKKHLLAALAVSVAGNIVATIITFFINVLYTKEMTKLTDDVQILRCTIFSNIINLAMCISLFVAVIVCLKGTFNKIYTPTAKGTKTSEISLTVVTIVMLIIYIVYYLMIYVNPIFYYIDWLNSIN